MDSGGIIEKIGNIKMPIRVGIFLGTLVLLTGAFLMLFYFPMKEDIKKGEQEIRSLENKLRKTLIKAKKIKEFEAEFARAEARFQEALRLLPKEKEIPSLLKTITQLGSDSRLQFRLFSPRKETSKGFYMEIPVSIEVSGSYHDVAVFFDKVGRMDRIVNILNVSMKPVKKLSTTLLTTCDAVTYRFTGKVNEKKKKGK
ncbi:MAG: type 4a pilus biogenesis protein PilO [Deltaproteobacteria bacterium]|nr:type 4a pilus biogenesis protein PilO [Deltaproteobacteria bacterium]MBW2302197.1 type 4a pilus biogenesis protein PilO [Deltaproteobacteria bacterium]